MICEAIRVQISEYIDDELDEVSKKAVAAHLAECNDCRSIYDQTAAAVLWLKQADDVQPPETLRKNVLQQLQLEQKITSRIRFMPGFRQAVAAAAVFVLLVAGNTVLIGTTENKVAGSPNNVMTLESEQAADYAEPAAPPQEDAQPADLVTRLNGQQKEDTDRVDSYAQSEAVESYADDAEADSFAAEGQQKEKKAALPYRLLLNIIGIPAFFVLLFAVLKKRREVLP